VPRGRQDCPDFQVYQVRLDHLERVAPRVVRVSLEPQDLRVRLAQRDLLEQQEESEEQDLLGRQDQMEQTGLTDLRDRQDQRV